MMGQRTFLPAIAGVTALAALAGVFGLAASAPDSMLSRSYQSALSDVDPVWERRLSGSVWLSHAPADAQSSLMAPRQFNPLERALAVGDRIKIAATAGGEKAIEVIGIEHVSGEGLGIAGVQFQIVTGRAVKGDGSQTVRFLFAVDAIPAPAGAVGLDTADRSL